MGVQLNIKDPETVRLARELAGRTGRTVTETIRAALERAYAEREADVADSMRFVKEVATEFRAAMPAEWHDRTSTEILKGAYEDDGSFAR